jgi:hypothetical protein
MVLNDLIGKRIFYWDRFVLLSCSGSKVWVIDETKPGLSIVTSSYYLAIVFKSRVITG